MTKNGKILGFVAAAAAAEESVMACQKFCTACESRKIFTRVTNFEDACVDLRAVREHV